MKIPFEEIIRPHRVSVKDLFPSLTFSEIVSPHMSPDMAFFGKDTQLENLTGANLKLKAFQEQHPHALLANGYLEVRAFYNTSRFERNGPQGKEYRNIHLGTDFWVPPQTPIHALFDSEVVLSHHNNYHKDYGPLLVLRHTLGAFPFYTLYGHLSLSSLKKSPKGAVIKKGEVFAWIGDETENGHWPSHLHFQVITDLLQETENYNGVAFPSEIDIWKERCPDPNFIFLENLNGR